MKKYVHIIIIVGLLILLFIGIGFYEKSHAQKTINVVSMTADEMSVALKKGTISGFILIAIPRSSAAAGTRHSNCNHIGARSHEMPRSSAAIGSFTQKIYGPITRIVFW